MIVRCEVDDFLPCRTREFTINGIKADQDDFGEMHLEAGEDEWEYGCQNSCFWSNPPSEEVLQKYHITAAEYIDVCNILHRELVSGNCGCCI